MKFITAVMLLAVLVLSACGGHERALSKGSIRDTWENQSDKTYLRVRGVGVAPDSAKGETKRRGLARNAALVSARYELLAIVKGIAVGGGLTIGQLAQTNGVIKETADRIMAGAEEEQVEFTTDGGCVVLMRLERSKVEAILSQTEQYEAAAR